MLNTKGHLTSAKGFRAATAQVGIKKGGSHDDVALVMCDVPCAAAGVFTRNVVKAAPVMLSQRYIKSGKAQAIIANSGNANCCTTTAMDVAEAMCRQTGNALGIAFDDVLVASTGVIGEPLMLAPIVNALPSLVERLDSANGAAVATAIMTTDTHEKQASVEITIDGTTVTIGAVAKGSGMIHPNMGTMLCFATTDAAIEANLLQKALQDATEDSFNMVSVDGDTSTNDTVFLLASGLAKNPPITENTEAYHIFYNALKELFIYLAKEIAGDGEGATHLLICDVRGAKSTDDAKKIAKSITGSSLFKAALYGADANWGRILCAAGYSGASFKPEEVTIHISSAIGRVMVCEKGGGVLFDDAFAGKILSESTVTVEVDLNEGEGTAQAYGCDLTCDYVRINGDYRS